MIAASVVNHVILRVIKPPEPLFFQVLSLVHVKRIRTGSAILTCEYGQLFEKVKIRKKTNFLNISNTRTNQSKTIARPVLSRLPYDDKDCIYEGFSLWHVIGSVFYHFCKCLCIQIRL